MEYLKTFEGLFDTLVSATNNVLRGRDSELGAEILRRVETTNSRSVRSDVSNMYTIDLIGGPEEDMQISTYTGGDYSSYYVYYNTWGEPQNERRLNSNYYSDKIFWAVFNNYQHHNYDVGKKTKLKSYKNKDRKLLEGRFPTNESKQNFIKEIKSLKYILEDDNYSVVLRGRTKTHIDFIKSSAYIYQPLMTLEVIPRPKIDITGFTFDPRFEEWEELDHHLMETEDSIIEYIDRLKEICDRYGYQTSPIMNIIKPDSVYLHNSNKDWLLSTYAIYHETKPSPPLLENKMYYKNISDMLDWLYSKADKTWVWVDTETTGLGGPTKTQLTQVSGLATNWDPKSHTFTEVDQFNDKIKLTDQTKSNFGKAGDRTKWVLGFNHYGDPHPTKGKFKYKDEKETIENFITWMNQFDSPFMIIQNASFDMSMLSGRYGQRTKNEVFDTKRLIQLYYLPCLQKLAETDPKYKSVIDKIGKSDRDHGLISSSMSKVGPALGVVMTGYHDAITDCRITIEMFKKIIEFLEQNKSIDISKYQRERIQKIKENE